MIDLKIKTKSRIELIDITEKVNHALVEIDAESGLCNIFVIPPPRLSFPRTGIPT